MKIAPNEELLKTWRYANSKTKSEKVEYVLSVTDKRIVSERIGGLSHRSKEIRLEDVSYVHASAVKQSIIPALIMFGIAAILLITSLVFFMQAESQEGMDVLGWVVLAVAAIFAIIGLVLLLKRACKLEVSVCVDKLMTPAIAVVGNTIMRKNAPSTQVVKLKVDKALADEIVEELGCLTLTK